MSYKPGDTYIRVITTNSSTGAAVNADSLPTAQIVHNGAVDTTVTVLVTNLATGVYACSYTIPLGYAAGDSVQLVVNATVGGVAGVAAYEVQKLDSKRLADITDASGRVTLTPAEHSLISGTDVPAALDASGSLESNLTLRQALRLMASVLLGPASGATGGAATITFSAAGNGGVTRVVANVDANGNRTSITLTP